MEALGVLLLLVLIGIPVIAVIALVRVRRLENRATLLAPQMLQRLYALEQKLSAALERLAELERKLAGAVVAPAEAEQRAPTLASEAPPATPAETAAPPPKLAEIPPAPPAATLQPPVAPAAGPRVVPTATAPPATPPPISGRAGGLDLETLIAGRWLNRVGIIALLLAVSFFIKYAFDNNWVGPRGRVGIGLVLGSALLPWSQWLLGRGYRYFSEGIAGLGAAVLYLSLWAGWHYYALFAQGTAFVAMSIVTAAMAAIAVGRKSQGITWIALVGGHLTPILLESGRDQPWALFLYLIVLTAGIIGIALALRAEYIALGALVGAYLTPVIAGAGHVGLFTYLAVLTLGMLAAAVQRRSELAALAAILGGFITPLLVTFRSDPQLSLFTYLAVVAVGLLGITAAREGKWKLLVPVGFAGTQIHFWMWHARFYSDEKLARTLLFATLLFILYAAMPLVRNWRAGQLEGSDTAIVLLNAFAYLIALRIMLWPERRWTLTAAVLALAATHLAAARLAPRPRAGLSLVRLLFAGLALMFVTVAIPIRLEGKWITIAWAVEGAVLVWSGLHAHTWTLRAAGLVLLATVAFRVAAFPIGAERFLLNARFATFSVAVVAFAAAVHFARRVPQELKELEKPLFAVLSVLVNIYALAALSLEAWDVLGRMPALELEMDRRLAQQLALSVVWTAYATALILLGVRRGAAMLRWQALALFGLVVTKVFLFDLSFLRRFYRIVSFLVLGLVLLVVSFLYQRKLAEKEPKES